jgi:hypothetical protein
MKHSIPKSSKKTRLNFSLEIIHSKLALQFLKAHLKNIQLKKQVLCFLFVLSIHLNAFAEDFDVQLIPSVYAGGYNISCSSAATGSINLFISGGNAPYTYSWSDGATIRNRTNLSAGYYRVTVTSSNGFVVKRDIVLKEPEAFQLNLHALEYASGINVSENGASNGAIKAEILGGVPPYSYLWSDGSNNPSLSNLPAGIYSLLVNDATNCSLYASVTLVEPSPLHVVSISSPLLFNSSFNTSACKGNDGKIFLYFSGGSPPYKFRWSNGAFTQNLDDITAGDYSVIISDANGTEVNASIVLLESPKLNANLNATIYPNGKNTSCADCSDGSINIATTSGSAPFSYSWSNGQISANINNLAAGSYKVYITDQLGCIYEESILLQAPERMDWNMNGNSNTNSAQHFIGTSDNTDFVFKANGIEKLRLLSNGATLFKDTVQLVHLAGKAGMLYLDENGKILNSETNNQTQNCGRTGMPIWNSNLDSNTVFTCLPTKVGIGTSSFPAGSHLHVNGLSLFDGNVQIGNGLDSFDLLVNGKVRLSALSNANNNSMLQTDVNGMLRSIEFPSLDSLNFWNEHSNGIDVYRSLGKVGISNPNPNATLDIVGAAYDTCALLNIAKAVPLSSPKTILTHKSNGEFRLGCDGSSSPWLPTFFVSPLLSGDSYLLGKVGVSTNQPSGQFQVGHRIEKIVVGSFYSGAPHYNANYLGFNAGRDVSSELWTIDNDGTSNSGAALIAGSVDGELRFITIPNSLPPQYLPGPVYQASVLSDTQVLEQIKMVIKPDGKIGIGQPTNYNGSFKLYVKGGIISDRIKVAVDGSPEWMDIVFDESYKLMSLAELEKYINSYKHLPEIPTTTEVMKDGIDIGFMQKKLLQKVEELSLYIIAQNKRIESLEKSNLK